jgi:signal transduction histidine kinase
MKERSEHRLQIRRMSLFVSGALLVLAMCIYGLLDVPWVAATTLTCAALSLAFVVAGSLQRPAEKSATRLLLIGSVAVLPPAMASGGLASSAVFWLLCAPFFAFEFLPMRKALMALAAELALIGLLAAPALWKPHLPQVYSPEARSLSASIDLLGLFVTMSALSFLALRTRTELTDRLESKNTMLKRMLQISGHDMANAVNVIDYSVRHMMETRSSMPEHLRSKDDDDILARMARQVFQLKSQIRKTRQIARWQAKIAIEKVPLDLSSIIHDAWSQCEALWKRKQIRLVVNNDDVAVKVLSDSVILSQQALQNYLSNAIKFSPPSGRIWIHGHCTHNKILLAIEDEGAGISKEILDNLSKPPHRTKPASTHGTLGEDGTGFGLRIASDLLKAIDVDVELINKSLAQKTLPFVTMSPNQGTLVLLIIPLALPRANDKEDSKEPRPPGTRRNEAA